MRRPLKAGAVRSRGGVVSPGFCPPGSLPRGSLPLGPSVPPFGSTFGGSGSACGAGRGAIVVGSTAPSFSLFSPAWVTAAVLTTLAGASRATSTVTTIFGYEAPVASVSLRVQVSVAVVQSQPSPSIEVALSPDGSVSVTLTGPLLVWLPALLATSAYVRPLSPSVKSPVCDFASVRSAPSTVTVPSPVVAGQGRPSRVLDAARLTWFVNVPAGSVVVHW